MYRAAHQSVYAVIELGLHLDHYSVSEQPLFNSSTVCIDINNGTLQREVIIILNTMDITAESIKFIFIVHI